MSVWSRFKGAVNNFYGGETEDYDEDYDEQENVDEEDDAEEDDEGLIEEGDNEDAYEEQEPQEEEVEVRRTEQRISSDKRKKLEMIQMKKDAITNNCSGKVEAIPCPVCHAQSIFKSHRLYDWVPLLMGARALGVTLNRFYCFNRRCKKSWFRGYVFNCTTSKFQPACVPTKRIFGAS